MARRNPKFEKIEIPRGASDILVGQASLDEVGEKLVGLGP
jgi:hypothetical protein